MCGCEVLDLLEVVQVVAGHGVEDGLEGERTAFGMVGFACEFGFAQAAYQLQVPLPERAKERECGGQIVVRIVLGPGVLIERLDEDLGLALLRAGEGLAQAEAEGNFAVGQVGDDLADTPLTGRDRRLDLLGGEAAGGLMEETRGGGEYGAGVLTAERFSVGVRHATQFTPTLSERMWMAPTATLHA